MTLGSNTIWTFAITSIALFMVTLDNLVVTTALPVIRNDLHASLSPARVDGERLHAHLRGAAPDRRGARRPLRAPAACSSVGLGIFTVASAAAALAPAIDALELARALQGVGGAIVTPLTLTILSRRRAGGAARARARRLGRHRRPRRRARPARRRRGRQGISWQWIFWLNVPIGLVLAPLAWRRLEETHGADRTRSTCRASGSPAPACSGSSGASCAATALGWASPEIVGSLVGGVAPRRRCSSLWELRAPAPMLPMRFFRNRTFALTNVASLFMFFGMFGSIFLLAQFFQTVQGYSPLQAGVRILPWTAMPIFIAPIAGALSDRIGGQRIMGVGLTLQAVGLGWIAAVSTPTTPVQRARRPVHPLGHRHGALLRAGRERRAGRRRPEEEGQASGANNAIRELGGVFGVAVLASIFASQAATAPASFVAGLTPAVWVGAAVVGLGALVAFAIPVRRRCPRARVARLEEAAPGVTLSSAFDS